jgi:intracellular multiplication protein IcmL
VSNASLDESRGRKGFYANGSRKLIMTIIFLACVNVGLIVSACALMLTKDDTADYYAVTCSSDPIKLNALSDAMVSAKQLLRWANVAAVSAYNYNFVNWRQRMGELRPYFSKAGWDGFYPSFKTSQLDPNVAKKIMVSAVATDVPVIELRGVFDGRYRWRVAVPLLITYQTASKKLKENILVRMVVSRVPVIQTPRGIAIVQFNTNKMQAAPAG